MALGAAIPEKGNEKYVIHQGSQFESGDEPIEIYLTFAL